MYLSLCDSFTNVFKYRQLYKDCPRLESENIGDFIRLRNMTIWCKHVHRLELQKFLIFVLCIHQLG